MLNRANVGTLLVALGMSSAAYAATATVKADHQVIENNGVVIAEVMVPEDAFVVIHPAYNVSVVLGLVAVKAGQSSDIKVSLDKPVKPGDKLWAMLHRDVGEKGKFEPNLDTPFMANGEPVKDSFKNK